MPIENVSMEEAIRTGEWALGMVVSKRYEGHFVVVNR